MTAEAINIRSQKLIDSRRHIGPVKRKAKWHEVGHISTD